MYLDGKGLFGADKERAGDGQMVIFAQNGAEVAMSNDKPLCVYANPADATPLDVLLIADVPLNESVVRYGPS